MKHDVRSVLAPIAVDAFLRDTWQRTPLHVERKDAQHYASLLSLRDLDSLIYFGRPEFLHNGTPVDPAEPPPPDVATGVLTPEERPAVPDLRGLYRQYAAGKTVYIHNFERFWHPVAHLCRTFEAFFHHPVDAGMFLTPPGARGLPAHYDDRDVFVMQLEGAKQWTVHAPRQELPLGGRTIALDEDIGAPVIDVVLQAGDLLYMPRGWVHAPRTIERHSLHVTLGVGVFRWVDLLRRALDDAAARDVRLREALPVGFLGKPPDATMFRELFRSAAEVASFDAALDALGEHFVASLPALPDGHFEAPQEGEIDLDTLLEIRGGLVCRIRDDGDVVGIQFPGNEVRGPRKIIRILQWIAAQPAESRFTARDVDGGDLTDNAKLIVVGRLVRERLLRIG